MLADDLFTASAEGVGVHTSPFEALEDTIRTFLHAYRDRAGMIRILEQATASSDEFLGVRLEIRKRFSARIEQTLRTQLGRHGAVDANVSERLDLTIGAYALGGMVEDFACGCYILHQLVEEEETIDTLAGIWARAIGLPQGSAYGSTQGSDRT